MAEYKKEYEIQNVKTSKKRRGIAAVVGGIASVLLAVTVGFGIFQTQPKPNEPTEVAETQSLVSIPDERPERPHWTTDKATDADAHVQEPAPSHDVEPISESLPEESPEPEPVPEAEPVPAAEPETVTETPVLELVPLEQIQEPTQDEGTEYVYETIVQETVTEPAQQTPATPQPAIPTTLLSKESMSLNDYVCQKASPSVVSIQFDDGAYTDHSSGVIISSDGLVISAYHGLRPNNNVITVTYEGADYPARILGYSAERDVVLLQMEVGTGSVTPIEIADSDSVEVGDWVMCMGAFGNTKQYNCGSVDHLNLTGSLTSYSGTVMNYQNLICTTASAAPGYSGGALLDENGRLIGMTVAITNDSDSPSGVFSFAVSSDLVSSIVSDILS